MTATRTLYGLHTDDYLKLMDFAERYRHLPRGWNEQEAKRLASIRWAVEHGRITGDGERQGETLTELTLERLRDLMRRRAKEVRRAR